MSEGLEVLEKETGEVYTITEVNSFEDIEKLIADLMMDRVKFFAALAVLARTKSRLYRRKLAVQDGTYNAYVEVLDFSDEAGYWKSTFSATKIRDKLYAENEEYAKQVRELEFINTLSSCVDTTVDFVRALERSTWGRYANKDRD